MIIIAMARLLAILLSAVLGSISLASGSRWIGECAQHSMALTQSNSYIYTTYHRLATSI